MLKPGPLGWGEGAREGVRTALCLLLFPVNPITAYLTLSLHPADLVSEYPGKKEVGNTGKGVVKAYDLEKVPAGVWEHVSPVDLLRPHWSPAR